MLISVWGIKIFCKVEHFMNLLFIDISLYAVYNICLHNNRFLTKDVLLRIIPSKIHYLTNLQENNTLSMLHT
jgi:hypothetical protein